MRKVIQLLAALANFGKQSGYTILTANPDLTPDRQRQLVDRELQEARLRLERLKQEVDVQGRRQWQ